MLSPKWNSLPNTFFFQRRLSAAAHNFLFLEFIFFIYGKFLHIEHYFLCLRKERCVKFLENFSFKAT